MADNPVDRFNDPEFITVALATVGQGEKQSGYLGDLATLQALTRSLCLEMYQAGLQDNMEQVDALTTQGAKILLGMDKGYTGMRKWNYPGGIDAFLAQWLGLREVLPVDRVKHAWLLLLKDFLDIHQFASEPGVKKEDWDFQIDALFDRYSKLFLGIDPPTQALM